MLDIVTAKLIKTALDEYFSNNVINLEDICRMQPVPMSTRSGGHTILATQFGDMTILVWIQFSEAIGVRVRAVKAVCW